MKEPVFVFICKEFYQQSYQMNRTFSYIREENAPAFDKILAFCNYFLPFPFFTESI